jgi:hypothetical protein
MKLLISTVFIYKNGSFNFKKLYKSFREENLKELRGYGYNSVTHSTHE